MFLAFYPKRHDKYYQIWLYKEPVLGRSVSISIMPIAAEYNDVDSRLLRKAADTGLDAFICDANEVIDLKLVRESKDVDDEETTFNPEMSHQVYGENETIFGYKDLKIKVQ